MTRLKLFNFLSWQLNLIKQLRLLFPPADHCDQVVIDHGSVAYRKDGNPIDDQPYHGVQRDVVCDAGYTLTGEEFSSCFAGEWSNDPPVCEPSKSG